MAFDNEYMHQYSQEILWAWYCYLWPSFLRVRNDDKFARCLRISQKL